MTLMFGFASADRQFGKALCRIVPRFDSLKERFAAVQLLDPIHHRLLVGIVDKPIDYCEPVPNHNGVFQVQVGRDISIAASPQNDDLLCRSIFDALRRAALTCPFSTPDRETFGKLFDEWAEEFLNANDKTRNA